MLYEEQHFIDTGKSVWNYSLWNETAIREFQSGTMSLAYLYMGAHIREVNSKLGCYFSVWAPHAKQVSVVGDFNDWNKTAHPLFPRLDHSGIWEGFIPDIIQGANYKYAIESVDGLQTTKADPYARFAELRPATASKVWQHQYAWKDKKWMNHRKKSNSLQSPWNVYEVHLGSWMKPDRNDEQSFNSYRQLADLLVPYVSDMGFTHVEFMPVMEFPYDKSWGYQCTGYFAATSRFGTPEDLMYLIDSLHQACIGVILDWVPSHFPGDAHGLYLFDGAHTYEYADMRKGFHPDWNSYIFNYKRGEVCSFLLSSAHYWLHYFHADGLRVDAVNSIIRLDFSRKEGEWEPNEYGNNANIEAIEFIRRLNNMVASNFPDTQTIAEEASDWPGMTLPIEQGGFGFGMKWMMGWMHDTFKYFKTHHHHRSEKQDVFTFSMMYFYDEKFMLPLSHDEIVHGKSPMIYKMPGLEHEKFAALRMLYGYMFTHPGAKLLFMGNEFAQTSEWNESSELDWHLLGLVSHQKMRDCVRFLCHLYKNEPGLYQLQFDPNGFEWLEVNKRQEGVLAYKRKGVKPKDDIIVVLNTSGNNYTNWSLNTKSRKKWRQVFNSNDICWWGTGTYTNEILELKISVKKTIPHEIIIQIPALSIQIFK